MKTHRTQRMARWSAAVIAMMIIGGVRGTSGAPHDAQATFRRHLKSLPFKIAWECYVNGNWEIFVMNADGSGKKNLTNTPGQHEHYPQISPDGTKIAYTVDTGEGRDAVRSLWVMDIHGKH